MNNFARRVESFVQLRINYHELVSGFVYTYIYLAINSDAIVENGRKGNRRDEVRSKARSGAFRKVFALESRRCRF